MDFLSNVYSSLLPSRRPKRKESDVAMKQQPAASSLPNAASSNSSKPKKAKQVVKMSSGKLAMSASAEIPVLLTQYKQQYDSNEQRHTDDTLANWHDDSRCSYLHPQSTGCGSAFDAAREYLNACNINSAKMTTRSMARSTHPGTAELASAGGSYHTSHDGDTFYTPSELHGAFGNASAASAYHSAASNLSGGSIPSCSIPHSASSSKASAGHWPSLSRASLSTIEDDDDDYIDQATDAPASHLMTAAFLEACNSQEVTCALSKLKFAGLLPIPGTSPLLQAFAIATQLAQLAAATVKPHTTSKPRS